MICRVVLLCLSTFQYIYSVAAQGECTDLRGRVISNGLHYVPGPDTCTLCVCDNGSPKVCKAVLCSPPQDCHSFRMSDTCCEFICLDDVVKRAEGAEANVRVAAGGAAAVFLLTVALIVYRVRRQKRRRIPRRDDQRSLTSIGYISDSMGYMGGTCESALGAWKPTGNYLPRGEAPPPYEEVVGQCRNDSMRMNNEVTCHRSCAIEAMRRAEEMQCAGHGYISMQRPGAQIANAQNCYNAPLLQPIHQADFRGAAIITHHPLAPNAFLPTMRLTGSLGAISGRALSVAHEPERPHNVPGFYTAPSTAVPHLALHRTIPRIATADTSTLEAMGFTRADRSLAGEVRRSFHRPERNDRAAGRSVPRNLDIASAANDLHRNLADRVPMRVGSGRSRAHSADDSGDTKPAKLSQMTKPQPQQPPAPPQLPPLPQPAQLPPVPQPAQLPPLPQSEPPHPTLPLTVDKPSCVCSYEGSGGAGAEDADDYRSECENCKSTDSSGWEENGEWSQGTQTLQRRAPPPPAPPPATATLPQPVTKHGRTGMGSSSNWENWFNTIPDSDSESEEE